MLVIMKCSQCGFAFGSHIVKGRKQTVEVNPVCHCVKDLQAKLEAYYAFDDRSWRRRMHARKGESCQEKFPS